MSGRLRTHEGLWQLVASVGEQAGSPAGQQASAMQSPHSPPHSLQVRRMRVTARQAAHGVKVS